MIKTYEKINKGVKSLNNENQNNEINILKNLTYVSKLNNNQKEMNKISQILMKNLKLNFLENNIKYEEYYFNGLPVPIEIQVIDIQYNGFKLSWKIEDINIINKDKNRIKYIVEIRNDNEQFKSIYEGSQLNCNLDKLNSDTSYEIRIYSTYDNIKSIYSEIKKVKTNQFDSILLNGAKRCDEFLNKIYEWTGGKNMELLYRGTRDGMSSNTFHSKCNNKGNTICLFQNEKGYIFGGYAAIDWTSCENYRTASDSFIFTLTNMYNIEPTKFPNIYPSCSIWDGANYGPIFGGHDIFIAFSSNYAKFTNTYKDILGKGYSIFKGDNDNCNFNLKEIEVFKLIK